MFYEKLNKDIDKYMENSMTLDEMKEKYDNMDECWAIIEELFYRLKVVNEEMNDTYSFVSKLNVLGENAEIPFVLKNKILNKLKGE